ncbi:MAG: hypothetical protein ABSC51_01575 [Gaiellaceae bacterium]|jgi:hypothetical protein
MEFELEWLHPSLLICRVSGVSTVEGCEAIMRAVISEPQYRPGIGVITVETGVDVSALTAADIEQIANLNAQFAHVPAVRSAVVVGPHSPTRYGLARMFEAYTESQENTEVEVFETLGEAMAWINEGDSRTPTEASPPSRNDIL